MFNTNSIFDLPRFFKSFLNQVQCKIKLEIWKYKSSIEEEIVKNSNVMIDLVSKLLIPNANSHIESLVLYYKILGDMYRFQMQSNRANFSNKISNELNKLFSTIGNIETSELV